MVDNRGKFPVLRGVWIALLSLGWLIPNHYQPWPQFYLEAWVAILLLLGSFPLVFTRRRSSDGLYGIFFVSLALGLLPWIQHWTGLIPWPSDATVSSIYVASFAYASMMGSRWEKMVPLQLPDSLFSAILIAAILSFVLQVCQWAEVPGLDFLLLGPGYGRPAANLGQPNHLGTLLLWGVVAALWARLREEIPVFVTIPILMCLVLGIALSGSRTAILGLAILFLTACAWRRLLGGTKAIWLGIGLGVFFCFCLFLIPWISSSLSGDSGLRLAGDTGLARITQQGQEFRPAAWRLFFEAALERPIFGYGWNQTHLAQLQMFQGPFVVHNPFGHAHNFFLDLVLWCGIPLGALLIGILLRWFWVTVRAINSGEDVLMFWMLLILANHAMLELPLNYMYFLIPAALIMGVLNTRLHSPVAIVDMPPLHYLAWGCWLLLAVICVRDYALVEQAERQYGLERVGFRSLHTPEPPNTWLLTKWHGIYRFLYLKPQEHLPECTLQWAREVANYSFNPSLYFQLATLLALNDRREEARLWLERFCSVVPEENCAKGKIAWLSNGKKNKKIAGVKWPKE